VWNSPSRNIEQRPPIDNAGELPTVRTNRPFGNHADRGF
jgi:hypothetical protein